MMRYIRVMVYHISKWCHRRYWEPRGLAVETLGTCFPHYLARAALVQHNFLVMEQVMITFVNVPGSSALETNRQFSVPHRNSHDTNCLQ